MNKTKQMVIIHSETFAESCKRDASTFALAVALIGVGSWIGSVWLEVAGFLVWILFLVTIATNFATKRTFTIKEARAELDRLEAQK